MNLNKSSLVALILASIGLNALAQSKNDEPKGDKKISLMIVTEEDGQKTIIDTTFFEIVYIYIIKCFCNWTTKWSSNEISFSVFNVIITVRISFSCWYEC